MKKYLGIVKTVREGMFGVAIQIKTRFSDDKEYLNAWIALYPGCENMLMDNSAEFNTFFEDFVDSIPVTPEEEKESRELFNEFMKNLD